MAKTRNQTAAPATPPRQTRTTRAAAAKAAKRLLRVRRTDRNAALKQVWEHVRDTAIAKAHYNNVCEDYLAKCALTRTWEEVPTERKRELRDMFRWGQPADECEVPALVRIELFKHPRCRGLWYSEDY